MEGTGSEWHWALVIGAVGKESEVAAGTEGGVWEVSRVMGRQRALGFHCGAGGGRQPTPMVSHCSTAGDGCFKEQPPVANVQLEGQLLAGADFRASASPHQGPAGTEGTLGWVSSQGTPPPPARVSRTGRWSGGWLCGGLV